MGAFADLVAEYDSINRNGDGLHFAYRPQSEEAHRWDVRGVRCDIGIVRAFGRTGEEALRNLVAKLREAG